MKVRSMITRTFPGNFKSLEPISDFIVNRAEEAGFSAKDVYAIQTAVDEACSNIIDHAYGGENKGNIEIKIQNSTGELRILLYDKGEPFDPEDIPDPDISSPLEIRKERGLGIYFMKKLMDRVIFEFSPSEGNKLTLIKFKGS
jgi:serine/threonine-protein kinase RsbW